MFPNRSFLALTLLLPAMVSAQTVPNLAALDGLAPVSILLKTKAGKAALGANYAVTGGIQIGEWRQPTLYPFAEQQQQALRDVFISDGNLAQLADGLGTTLGAAWQARAHYLDRDTYLNISPAIADVISYAVAAARSNSNSGKYFFANLTTDGKKEVSAEARAILQKFDGVVDIFGAAHHLPAGSEGADKYGDSRPFQTQPSLTRIIGRDYFGNPADNYVYNYGPMMDLINSPSYPSGHTTYGYTGVLMLAMLVPDRYPELMARGADYGNNRIIVGAHYVMDVLGGRALALWNMAHLLANDPPFLNQEFKGKPVLKEFRNAVMMARQEVTTVLEAGCGKAVAICAREDIGRFSDEAANTAFYASTQTYGQPVVYPDQALSTPDVGRLAPEAGYLLTVAYPSITLNEANEILTRTLGPGGRFLDNGSEFGIYSRLDLYRASLEARRLAASR